MTNQVIFPTDVGGDGSTVTDDSSATTGLANGGFRVRLLPMFTQIINVATWILGKASAAGTSAANAAASESEAEGSASAAAGSASASADSATAAEGSATAASDSATASADSAAAAASSATSAQGYAAAMLATSTSAVVIGTGSKTFATQAGKQFSVGQFVSIVSAGTPENYMHGQVTSYSGTALVVNVLDIGGSGSPSDWNISISGTQGPRGIQGDQGDQGVPGGYTGTANGAVDEVKGANIASAATVNLEAATGNLVHITGTTTITAITLNSGAERTVVFDGALTLTNSASLILPGGANITTAVGDSMKVRGDGAGVARVVGYTHASGVPIVTPALPYIHVREQQPNSTPPAAVSAGNRVLNTVVTNTITGASLSSNQITLPAGTYRIHANAPVGQGGFSTSHQAYLYSVSDAAVLVAGTSEYANQTVSESLVKGTFTLPATKVLSIRHYVSQGTALGQSSGSGQGEVYTQVEITKVA